MCYWAYISPLTIQKHENVYEFINVLGIIRGYWEDFFPKKNKRTGTSIRQTRVDDMS